MSNESATDVKQSKRYMKEILLMTISINLKTLSSTSIAFMTYTVINLQSLQRTILCTRRTRFNISFSEISINFY